MLVVVACGQSPMKVAGKPDAGLVAPGGADAGRVSSRGTDAALPAALSYQPCGDPVACAAPSEPRWFGNTCICTPSCLRTDAYVYGAPSCPAGPAGASPPFCDDLGYCEIPCQRLGEATGCPDGLVCGVDIHGNRCIATAAVVGSFTKPDPRSTISDFELYGACRTYETPTCPKNAMGTSDAFTNSAECFCSARCFDDGDCPVPPAGYGRALCMHQASSLTRGDAGYCALVCADATGSFPCPMGLSCKSPPPASCSGFFYRPASDVSVCRGGYYRHGDGDGVIGPGELYGLMRSVGPVCDPNLGTAGDSAAEGGYCVESFDCCVDSDCPAPPPAYGSPFCAWDGCHLPCATDADCPTSGFECTKVDIGPLSPSARLGCD